METHPVRYLKSSFRRHRRMYLDGFMLLLFMVFAMVIACKYDIFSPVSVAIQQENSIDLDEGLALAALFCAGLLMPLWRVLLSQRHEVIRRIAAEHVARSPRPTRRRGARLCPSRLPHIHCRVGFRPLSPSSRRI
jgi:hypothetical protein